MKILLSTLCLLATACPWTALAEDLSVGPLITRYGYPFEEHKVTTEDGYILTVHRIPYSRNSPGKIGRPVLLQHGILVSSACYVLTQPNNSLGFIMSDYGYDVWMPNNRGNTYSLGHKTLDPKKDAKKYWDFSFHEMGYYDLSASIDFILSETNQSSLYYIGHSQGTTQFFALMSTRPEYNKKVVHMSALAPIAFLDHTRGTLAGLKFFGSTIAKVCNFFHIYDLLASTWYIRALEDTFCKTLTLTKKLCENILFLITGYDSQEIDVSLIPTISTYFPAGASVKQLVHYDQLTSNGELFRQYDYGEAENKRRYNQSTPPDYDLSKVTVPVMLHYSQNDWISGIQDVMKLKSQLPQSDSLLVPFYYFNHMDFMWAKDVWELLYKPMLEIIEKF